MTDLRPFFRNEFVERFVPEQLCFVGDQFCQQERPDAFLGFKLSDHAQRFDEVLLVFRRVAFFSQMFKSQRAERRNIVVVGSSVDVYDES